MSIDYLIPGPVIEYIQRNGLYEFEGKVKTDSGRASPALGSSASKS